MIDTFKNESGSAIVAALLMGLALSLAVFIAMDNSLFNSRTMRNSRQYIDNLYRGETGITVACEENRTTWLASASNLFQLTNTVPVGNANVQITDENGNPLTVASYVIARIEIAPTPGTLSDSFPYKLNHQAPPPIGSKSSVRKFEIRRFGIRSTVQPANTLTVESGLYKTFNKY
ncbi:MAG: hypothetical protein GY834_07300 [Bacteroidetes bacterium]|nr:hypothetical protein [Bacteroidota bacterium]